jgi:hypothetical protein
LAILDDQKQAKFLAHVKTIIKPNASVKQDAVARRKIVKKDKDKDRDKDV